MPRHSAKRSPVGFAVGIALLGAGCAGGTAPTAPPTTAPFTTQPAPSATPASTVGQTAPATPTPSGPSATPPEPITTPIATPLAPCVGQATTATFEPDAIICAIEDGLRLRSRPSTSEASLKFEPLVAAGQRLFVITGPVDGDGYGWYLVQKTPGSVDRADGWIAAAAKDGTPWLGTTTVSCPGTPSLQDLAAMDVMQRVHCYHAREFTFTDTVVAGPNCGDGVVLKSPTWMAGCTSTFYWGRGLSVAVPPALAASVGDVDVDVSFNATITAHMDDPAALTCVPNEGFEADYELLNPGTILACRGMFVATSFQRVNP